jgi:L-ascorbate metabolism protein UlaG (beta-lactamase superfamily)
MKSFLPFLFLCVFLSACSSDAFMVSTDTKPPGFANTPQTCTRTPEPTDIYFPPSPTASKSPSTATVLTPTATETARLPTATPFSDCVSLIYGGYAQFEIISRARERILVDVYDPDKLSRSVLESDLLLTTHMHWDHWNEGFQTAFPGLQLFVKEGFLKAPGVLIQGIASAHNAGNRLRSEGGTNYIYMIETGGLRVVHFGDIGQESFTDEQLTILGAVDVAIMQINNPYSEMDAENRKAFRLMDQLEPRLVIPTHLNLDTVKLAVSQWDAYYADSNTVEICEYDFSTQVTKFLLMGDSVETMLKYVDLKNWEDR